MKKSEIEVGQLYAIGAPNSRYRPSKGKVLEVGVDYKSRGGRGRTVTNGGARVISFRYNPHEGTETVVPLNQVLHTWEEEEEIRERNKKAKAKRNKQLEEAKQERIAKWEKIAEILGVNTAGLLDYSISIHKSNPDLPYDIVNAVRGGLKGRNPSLDGYAIFSLIERLTGEDL